MGEIRTATLHCLKYCLFVLNLLLSICGAVMLGVGIWAAAETQNLKEILTRHPILFNGVYLIIVVGAIMMLVGFVGCCGTKKTNKRILRMFFYIMFAIFVTEIVGVAMVFEYLPEIREETRKSIGVYGTNSTAGTLITHGWDTLQVRVGCCGYDGFGDWNGGPLAESCCKRNKPSADGAIINKMECRKRNRSFIYTEGCEAKLSSYIWVIGAIAMWFLLLESMSMVATCFLYQISTEDSEDKDIEVDFKPNVCYSGPTKTKFTLQRYWKCTR